MSDNLINQGEMPLISIIVPVYNIKEYIERCVKSIQEQTYRNLEIILVDDGSTDGTEKILDELAAGDERIKVFHKENGGSSTARNLAITKSTGDYLGFVDSDDFLEPDMIELLYDGIKRHGVKCTQIGRDERDEQGNALPDICIPPEKEEIISSRDFLKELLMHRGDCSFCTKLIEREVFFQGITDPIKSKEEENKEGTIKDKADPERRYPKNVDYTFFPVGKLNEDFHILIKILPQIGDIVSLPGYKYHVFYRIGSNSRKESRDQFSRVYADCVENAYLAQNIVKERYPGDKELEKIAFRFAAFQRIEYLLHIPIGMMDKKGAAAGSPGSSYPDIVKWIRKNWGKAMVNPILTAKNKAYLTLFAIAPRGVRRLHKKLKKIE